MLMQSQNRQLTKLQEDHMLAQKALEKEHEENVKTLKEQNAERVRHIEKRLAECQREATEKVIEARKVALKEAEDCFARQKTYMVEEMKKERERIMKEIVEKLAEEHMTKIQELRAEIRERDESAKKLEAKLLAEIEKAAGEDCGAETELQSREVGFLPLVDIIVPSAKAAEASSCKEEPKTKIEEQKTEAPKAARKPPLQNLVLQTAVQELNIVPEERNVGEQLAGEEEKRCRVLYAKMQTANSMSKALVDVLNSRLKAKEAKFSGLCRTVQDLQQFLK